MWKIPIWSRGGGVGGKRKEGSERKGALADRSKFS